MTPLEFKVEFDRLAKEFPMGNFGSEARAKLVFESVKNLDRAWLRSLVDRMIRTNNPKLDFDEAARAERSSFESQRLSRELTEARKALLSTPNKPAGLSDFLKQLGATSVIEAMRKINK